MKLGLTRRLRSVLAYWNLFQFSWRKRLLGFEYANVFLQRVDKRSAVLILKKNGARIGENCDIESGLTFHNCTNYANFQVGRNCHIGKNCFFDLRGAVVLEDNVVVSMRCNFITHIDLSKSPLSGFYPSATGGIRLRENCYIGASSTILKGVTIGKDAFVGASALVLDSVPARTLVGGVPARKLREIGIEAIQR